MKPSILFVDDETMVLDAMRRMLRPMRAEWDFEFTDSGEAALQRLDEKSFDIVVSDMRMPGMNGAELLNRIQERFPQTIRLILSGYSDQELIMNSVGSAHQYLAKPCEAEAVKSTIRRALSMRERSLDQALITAISRMESLPSLPDLYFQIVEKLKDPNTELEDVSAIVRKDIGMTSNLLKLVNSAFFGLNHQITDINDAVSYLGMERVKNLALVMEFFNQYENRNLVPLDPLWEHSMRVAAVAKSIGALENFTRKEQETVFLAGMLHDVGKLVLLTNFSETYSTILQTHQETGQCLCLLEQSEFQANHAEIGSCLLGLWGMDEFLVASIMDHHRPPYDPETGFTSVLALHVADALVHERDGSNFWGTSSGLDEDLISEWKIGDRLSLWRENCLETLQPA